jgi:hypothetical protein
MTQITTTLGAIMARSPKAEEQIAERNPVLVLPHLCTHTTDPAVGGVEHTEFFLQLDKPTQKQLMAAKLEANAASLKALADGHTRMATVLKSGG